MRWLAIASVVLGVSVSVAWGDELYGSGAIWAKDSAARALFIGEHVYHVTSRTEIRDRAGRLIRLTDVAVPEVVAGGTLPAISHVDGDYRAEKSGGRLILRSLTLMPLEGE